MMHKSQISGIPLKEFISMELHVLLKYLPLETMTIEDTI